MYDETILNVARTLARFTKQQKRKGYTCKWVLPPENIPPYEEFEELTTDFESIFMMLIETNGKFEIEIKKDN